MHQDLSFRLISSSAASVVAICLLLCSVNIVVGDENIETLETSEASQFESVADDRQAGQVMETVEIFPIHDSFPN